MNTKLVVPPCRPLASFNRRRNRATPPSSPRPIDLDESSSCSASATTVSPTSRDSDATELTPCNLLSIISDARFRPIFDAIEEIKGRKCRPDFERILKCIEKQSSESERSYERHEILLVVDELLKLGLVTKVFHKGGFTIRIKNEKYAKLIEKMNICYNQKTPTTTPMSPRQALATAATVSVTQGATQPWVGSKDCVMNSNGVEINEQPPKRETPSPALTVPETGSFQREPSNALEFPSLRRNGTLQTFQVADETMLDTSSTSAPATAARTKRNRKRNRVPTPPSSNRKKKSPSDETRESMVPSTAASDTDEFLSREPFVTRVHLPPVTIEQLLGLRGDVPDVHRWSTNELSEFFRQQGFDFAASILHKHRLNGEDLYRLRREEVLRMRTLKLGQALKLWNVIEQIQRQSFSSS